jgi:ribosomal-protein-alanine N-acetyltransferase
MVVLILPMTPGDVDAIVEIEKLSFSTPWSRSALLSELRYPRQAVYLVARVKGRVVGYVGMWTVGNEGHITNIAVHPDYRGKGVGTRLLSFLIAVARSRDINALTLEVRQSNVRARKLYERMGFVASGIRTGYYCDNNEDAIIMWRYEQVSYLAF